MMVDIDLYRNDRFRNFLLFYFEFICLKFADTFMCVFFSRDIHVLS